MKFKKLLASACTALLLGLGLSLVATTSASAHSGAVTGVASCEADGTYSVTWTYNATNVPNGVEAETKAMTTNVGSLSPIDGVNKGGQVFLSVWSDHQINVPGAPVKTGNWSAQFKTVGIPGNHVGDVTTMVQTDWKGGPSEDPVGKVIIDGECTQPPVVPEKPTPYIAYGEWSDWTVDCDAATAERGRWSWTVDFEWDGTEWVTVLGEEVADVETREATAEECPVIVPDPVYVLNTSHVIGSCDAPSTIALENDSPWFYRVLIEVSNDDGTTWVREPSSTDGVVPGVLVVQGNETGTYAFTFPEDSGEWLVRYKVSSGAESDLYKDLPVGEFTTFAVTDTDCEVNVPEKPEPVTVASEWSGAFECGDTIITETRTVTNVGHRYDAGTNTWVADPQPSDRSKTETRERDLTAEEIEALDCPVVPEPEEPVVDEPTTEAPKPVVAKVAAQDTSETLAVTGAGPAVTVWGLTFGALAVALGALSVVFGLRRRQMTATDED